MYDKLRMKIEKNTIVSLRYKLTDAQNNVIEEPDSPMVYLHGGSEGTFPKIESLLDGQDVGSDADEESEDISASADDSDDADDEPLIYTVTDVADNQVVLDGNHPLAGMALRFWVQVEDVRAATEDEIENRHPEGGENFSFGMPNEDSEDADEEDYLEQALGLQGQAPRTLH